MFGYTLAFADAAREARYTTEAFRSACAPFVAFCGVDIVLNAMLAITDPGMIAEYTAAGIGFGVLLAARLWLDRMPDQQRARLLFGRVINVATLIAWLVIIVWLHYHPPELVSAGAAAFGSLLWFLIPIYLHLSAVHTAHRLAYVAVSVLGISALPTFSELGRPVPRRRRAAMV